MSEYTYISAVDTAKMIRKALKSAFPGVRFWVKTSTYSGGASIDIDWIDGPAESEVNRVIAPYRGADFDGMVDLKTYRQAWMMPDGSVKLAKEEPRAGQIVKYAQPEGARLVHFGADFIFTRRHFSDAGLRAVLAPVCEEFGEAMPEFREDYFGRGTFEPNINGPEYYGEKEAFRLTAGEAMRETSLLDTKPDLPDAPDKTEAIEITYDRDWTWIKFPTKPSERVLDLMKSELQARFSRRRMAWYICERVAEDTIRLKLAIA